MQNMFSVGVCVDKSGVMSSKNGKKFLSFKITDLQKHDRELVRKSLSKMTPESAKIQMSKLFNPNMYRVINLMCFSENAAKIHKLLQIGSVYAIIAPKYMPAKPGDHQTQLYTYTIDNENNLVQLGYSQDYDVCKGQDSNPRTPAVKTNCCTFVNKSIEKLCDRHELQVQQS